MPQILVFGDSITYGAWDIEGGWVQRLRKWIDRINLADDEFYCLVYNLGVSGETSSELIERFESETKRRIKEGKETILIFSIGMNDTLILLDEKAIKTSAEQFKKNIETLLKLAKKYSSKIVFVGLIPVDESRTIPVAWNKNKAYSNKIIREYNQIAKKICEQQQVVFVDVFDTFESSGHEKLLEDGLHPNSRGHKIIFEMVRNSLLKKDILKAEQFEP
jgi:lysophospholipase L1-like esterase